MENLEERRNFMKLKKRDRVLNQEFGEYYLLEIIFRLGSLVAINLIPILLIIIFPITCSVGNDLFGRSELTEEDVLCYRRP
eukprot:UN09513